MTPESWLRFVRAVERIADVMEKDHSKRYPAKSTRDADITYVKTGEEALIEDQQGEDLHEPIDRWTTLGPRESAYLRKHSDEDGDVGGPDKSGTD